MPLLAVILVVVTLGASVDWVTALLVGPGGFLAGCVAGWFFHAFTLGSDEEKP